VLYLPAIPSGQGPTNPGAAVVTKNSKISSLRNKFPFGGAEKLGSMYNSYSSLSRSFLGQVISVLSGASMVQSINVMVARGRYAILPFRVLDGIFHWVFMVIQLGFPFFVALMVYINIMCY
jgi:hypothetical protein